MHKNIEQVLKKLKILSKKEKELNEVMDMMTITDILLIKILQELKK